MLRRALAAFREAIRRYFVAGLLFSAPIAITIWVISKIVVWLDNLVLPHLLRLLVPGLDEPPPLPLVGMLFTFFVIIMLGVMARHLFGGEIVRAWERLLSRVPVARNIYRGIKQLVEAIFSQQDAAARFRRVIMIEYPRKGVWALAFTTGRAHRALEGATDGPSLNCFLPTTPNPTSGFYLLVPENEVREVNLTVEQAFKLVMSAGLVSPDGEGVPAAASGEISREPAATPPGRPAAESPGAP